MKPTPKMRKHIIKTEETQYQNWGNTVSIKTEGTQFQKWGNTISKLRGHTIKTKGTHRLNWWNTATKLREHNIKTEGTKYQTLTTLFGSVVFVENWNELYTYPLYYTNPVEMISPQLKKYWTNLRFLQINQTLKFSTIFSS